MAVPSPLVGWFDGLPWDGRAEMFLLVFLVPLLAFWQPLLFASRALLAITTTAVLLKAGLWMGQNAEGLKANVYENREKFEMGTFECAWESLWSSGSTALQRRGWNQAREFPLEWLNRYDMPHRLPGGMWEGEKMRQDARPWVRVSGWVWTRPGETVVLDLGSGLGVVSAQISKETQELQRGARIEMKAPSAENWSPLEICFQIDSVSSPNVRFVPLLRFIDGREKPLFGLNRTGVCEERRPGLFMIGLGPWLSRLIDGLVGLCLLVPVLGIFRQFSLPISVHFFVLTILAAGVPALAGALGMELTGRLTYGLLPAFAYAILARPLVEVASPGRVVFWVLGVGAMPQFAVHWWGDMGGMSFFEVGDDWLAQQNLARAIFVGGDWLSFISEKIYVYQPGYRYFTGTLHVLFGQSAWPSRMLDAWAVVAVGSLVPALCLWAGTGWRWSLIAGFLAFAAYCSRPPFRLMGQCIHEYVGAALLVGVAWIIVNWNQLPLRFVLLGITAAAAYLVRQNHILAILACGLFFLPRLEGSWADLLAAAREKIRQNLPGMLVLVGAVVCAALAVCLRNWLSGGVFNINTPANLATNFSASPAVDVFRMILCARQDGVSFMGWLIISGSFCALGCFLRLSFWKKVPLQAGLLLAACWLPFFKLRPYASTERFSFCFVPFASFCLISSLVVPARNFFSQSGKVQSPVRP